MLEDRIEKKLKDAGVDARVEIVDSELVIKLRRKEVENLLRALESRGIQVGNSNVQFNSF